MVPNAGPGIARMSISLQRTHRTYARTHPSVRPRTDIRAFPVEKGRGQDASHPTRVLDSRTSHPAFLPGAQP